MTPMEALNFIDRVADGGLGAPDYAEALFVVQEALNRLPVLEQMHDGMNRYREALESIHRNEDPTSPAWKTADNALNHEI